MRLIGLACVATAAIARPPAQDAAHVADAAVTRALNVAVRRDDAAVVRRNRAAQDAYAAGLARFEAATRENDRLRGEAARAASAYRASRAAYEADLAAWRARDVAAPR